jgi:hypothetical protein
VFRLDSHQRYTDGHERDGKRRGWLLSVVGSGMAAGGAGATAWAATHAALRTAHPSSAPPFFYGSFSPMVTPAGR